MSRWRILCASALLSLIALVGTPGLASAEAPGVNVTSVEMLFEIASFDQMNIIGTGVCVTTGPALIFVEDMEDLETGATTANASSTTNCVAAGEHVSWSLSQASFDPRQFRAGDRVSVQVLATGAITGEDLTVTVLKQFH
jgi:hypothetical protein